MARGILAVACVLGVLLSAAFAPAQELAEDGTPYEAPQLAGAQEKIHPSLISRLSSPEMTPVIVYLKDQSVVAIADEVKERYEPAIAEREDAARAIHRNYSTEQRPANPEEARLWVQQQQRAYTKADRDTLRALAQEMKSLKDQMRDEINERSRRAVEPSQAEVSEAVRTLKGAVTYTYFIENAMAVRLPGSAIHALASHPLVERVVEDRQIGAELDVSAPAIFADTFWDAGQSGGIWYNATLDTGVDTSHPALIGKTWWEGVFHNTAKFSSSYADSSTSTNDLHGHGSHVAGIMGSAGATYRGISWGSTRSTNLKAGYLSTTGSSRMYWSDAMAAVNWGVNNATIDALNFSFGDDSVLAADDDDFTRFFDGVVNSRGVVVSKSAGNEGSADGTLTSPAGMYNGLVVANMRDQGTVTRTDDAINSGSSRGPTPSNRKKPDIAAPGTSITACNNDWETETDYVSKSGTSMAAPHIGGAATLLHDVGISDPRAVKAVLINTADFMPGQTTWDNAYGWGYVNLDRAYLQRTNWFLDSITPRDTANDGKLYKVPDGHSGDKATMAWNRRAIFNGASTPTTYYSLSDLNLRLYRESTGFQVASSLEGNDNVEQVVSDTAGSLVIKGYAWSTGFAGASTETYALAAPPGTVRANGPDIDPDSNATTYTPPLNAKFRVLLRAENSGDLNAHSCYVSFTLPAGVVLVSGPSNAFLGTIAAGEASDWVEVWLKATSPGPHTIGLSATSVSYGNDYIGVKNITVTPGAADLVSPYSVLNIGGTTYQSGGTDLVANGGFESSFAGWATSGVTSIVTGDDARTGEKCARVGPGSSSIYQTVTVPDSGRALLTFYYQSSAGLLAAVGCSIQDSSGNPLVYPFQTSTTTIKGWYRRTIDLTRFKGQTIRVAFYSSGFLGAEPTLWLDDISLKQNETVWVGSTGALNTIVSRDDRAGIDYSEHRISSGAWTSGESFGLPEDGNFGVYYRSADNGANLEPEIYTVVGLDTAPPMSVLSVGTPSTLRGGSELLTNPGFESSLIGWSPSGAVTVVGTPVHSGSNAARVGSSGSGTLTRVVSIPAAADRAFAGAWVYAIGVANPLSSYSVSVLDADTGSTLHTAVSGNILGTSGWVPVVWDVSRFSGKTLQLRFSCTALIGAAPTLYVDDASVRWNSNLYVKTATDLKIGSFDHVGVADYSHSVDGGVYTSGQTFNLVSEGGHAVRYRAKDHFNRTEAEVMTQINVDESGPAGSVAINNGAPFTTSTAVTLNISAADPAGVHDMRIRNEGSSYGPWMAYATSKPWSLPSGSGTKTVYIQFRDELGNLSGDYSDSIDYLPPDVIPIGDAKLMGPHPVAVLLKEKRVSGVFSGPKMLYIQEDDRSSGIKVNGTTLMPGAAEGQVGDFEGVLQLDSGNEPELYLTAYTAGSAGLVPEPVMMSTRFLGGGPYGDFIPGMTGGTGLHNTGLLVGTFGRVVWLDASTRKIRIDDGSGALGGGILVDLALSGTLPAVGDFVMAVGNLGCALDGGDTLPVIRVRKTADIGIL